MRALILFLFFGIGIHKNQSVEETYQFKPLLNHKNALQESKQNKKLTLLYFSAYGSVICEMMKENVFGDANIKSLLKQKYCSFKAMVDDKTPIPKAEQYISKLDKKPVLTVGARSIDIQVSVLKTNIQPYFVIIDENGKQIRHLVGKTNAKDFLKFLVGK
ncbi:thioredoxin family protein [Pedobacter agri]|uniref:thioredoxin family protein n=1 Tax=Pedobacter agri TaxID=454586 RepID=UPI00292D5D19|nr:thioredoxin family protein [Pedobacter agri]